jgi:redox-sensing transcriptional repressor
MVISPMSDLRRLIRSRKIAIGVITTPAPSAQQVCDAMAAAGVRSILNFAPAVLTSPPGVNVRRVDLSTELHVLAFREMQVDHLEQPVEVAR